MESQASTTTRDDCYLAFEREERGEVGELDVCFG